MRIGIDAQRIFRKTKHGMEVVAIETIRELQKIDSTNEYIIYTRKDQPNEIIEEVENFQIKEISAKSYADWEQYWLVREAKKDALDILHSMSNTGPIFYKGRFFLTLHDIIYMESVKFAGNPYQDFGNLYRRFIVPKVVKRSEQVFTVSHYEKERIIDFFRIPEERVTVLYNGVNPIFTYESTDESENSSNAKLPEDYILFLGNTAPKKNTVRLLNAYHKALMESVDIPPLVILDLSRDYLEKKLSRQMLNDLDDHVILLDYIPYSQMPSLYRNASIFVYPSLRESFGMPFLESMACGTPVITSNVTSMPEVAGGNALLCDPYNENDIADNIIKLLADKKMKNELSKKGLDWSEKFSWANTTKTLVDLYFS